MVVIKQVIALPMFVYDNYKTVKLLKIMNYTCLMRLYSMTFLYHLSYCDLVSDVCIAIFTFSLFLEILCICKVTQFYYLI